MRIFTRRMCRTMLLTGLLVAGGLSSVWAQRYAVADGNWTGAIWATTANGVAGSAATPTAADDVFTNGHIVTVSSAVTCKNLLVSYNVAGSLTFSGGGITVTGSLVSYNGSSPAEPTVNLFSGTSLFTFTAANYDGSGFFFNNEIIAPFNGLSPISRAVINTPAGTTYTIDSDIGSTSDVKFVQIQVINNSQLATSSNNFPLSGVGITATTAITINSANASFTSDVPVTITGTTGTVLGVNGILTLSQSISANSGSTSVASTGSISSTANISVKDATLSGTVSLNGGVYTASGATTISGTVTTSNTFTVSGTLTVSSGGSFNTSGATSAANATISGNVTTSNAFDVSGTMTLNSTGVFKTSYTGGAQGWWSSTSPSNLSLDPASTVYINANASQNLYAQTYGNLILDGSGTFTKTLTGTGTLNVLGSLTVNSSGITFNTNSSTGIFIGGDLTNNGTWSPTDLVTFNGSGAQSISGSSQGNYTAGMTVNKSAGTLTLNKGITLGGDLTITAGTLDLGSRTVTMTAGNIDNSGTLTASTSTIQFNGTSSVVGSATTTLNNVTIVASGSLTGSNGLTVAGTFTNGGTFNASSGTTNFSGNFTNNGTFNSNSGTLVFNGSSAQSIAGSATTAVNNVTISNSSGGVAINGTVDLYGALTLANTSAVFDADGSGSGVLTVKSTSVTSGGRIASLPQTSNFSGNVTVERFINGPDSWRYLAMPVTNGTVGTWQTYFPVTGNFSNPSPAGVNGVVSATAASIYSYNATTGAYAAVGSGGATGSTSLSNTVGYSAYTYLTSDVTVKMTGTIGKGTVNIPLGTGGSGVNTGYNLVPNPYPSPIDWDNVSLPSGLSSGISVRTGNNTFASYVQGGAATNPPYSGWTGEVATGQSFWVQSTSATNLALGESAKTTNAYEFLRATEPENLLRIALTGAAQRDEAVIWFPANATDTVDERYDALKRRNGNYISSLGANDYINISTYLSSASTDFAINGVSAVSCAKEVNVKIQDIQAGTYKLQFTNLNSFALGYAVTLVDNFLGKEITVSDSLQYSFDVTTDVNSYSARFAVRFSSPQVAATPPAMAVTDACEAAAVPVQVTTQAGINYQFSVAGTAVSSTFVGTGSAVTTSIDRTKLVTGMNSLDLVAASADGCHTQTFSNAFQFQLNALPRLPKVLSDTVCQSTGATLQASGAPDGGGYYWYDSLGSSQALPDVSGGQLVTDTLHQSTTYYVATYNADGCVSARAPVSAQVIPIAKPTVAVEGTLMTSSASSGNQWYFNGTAIAGATGQQYEALKSGTYTVQVTNPSSCSKTSDDVVMVVTGIEDNPFDGLVKVHPNPVKGALQVLLPAGYDFVRLLDGQGRVMQTYTSPGAAGGSSLQMDLSGYAAGLYLVNAGVNGKSYFVKVIKE